MKITRVLLVGVVAVAAALAGAVMLGSTTAGVKSTYYACADATTGALRRVPAEERCAATPGSLSATLRLVHLHEKT